jgi:hypothetical protein
MEKKKKLTEELKKEFKHQKVFVYPGPKQPFKTVMLVILTLLFIFGIGMLSTRTSPTGYAVLGYNQSNWYGILLLLIPLVLVLYWLRKQ